MVQSRAKQSGSDSMPTAEFWPFPGAPLRRCSALLLGSHGRPPALLSRERGSPEMSCRDSSLPPSPAWGTFQSRKCG